MTTNNMKLISTDVMEDGKLKAVEYHYVNGDFAFQALWDPRDEHTPEKIAEFRLWCCKMATRLGHTIEA